MINIPEEVKKLILADGTRKNIRIHFPYGEHPDITNNQIVQNSVTLTESLCSQDKLKLGLCEASCFECEVVGVGNIRKMQIDVQLEIDCSSLGEEWCRLNAQTSDDVDFPFFVIKYDDFVVESCTKQTDMTHRKIKAFTRGVNGFKEENPFVTALYNSIYDSNASTYTVDVAKYACANMNIINFGALKEYDEEVAFPFRENSSYLAFRSKETISREGSSAPRYLYNLNTSIKTYSLDSDSKRKELYQIITDKPNEKVYEWLDALKEYGYYYFNVDVHNFRNQIERTKKRILNGYYNASFLDSPSATSLRNNDINIGNDNCILPYLGTSYEGSSRPTIAVNYNFSIVVQEQYYNSGGTIISRVVELPDPMDMFDILKEKMVFRDRDSIHLNKVKLIDEVLGYNISIQRVKEHSDARNYILNYGSIDISEALQGALEIAGVFAKNDRNGSYEFISPLDIAGLYPSESLYPSDTLFPKGTQGYSIPATYSSGWYDDELAKAFGRISITYQRVSESKSGRDYNKNPIDSWLDAEGKNPDDVKTEKVYGFIDLVDDYNEDDYLEYVIDDNYYVENYVNNDRTIKALLERTALKIKDIRYMPCEIEAIGQPWLEAGDTLSIETTDGDVIKTIVLNRSLKGEQFLRDTITAK